LYYKSPGSVTNISLEVKRHQRATACPKTKKREVEAVSFVEEITSMYTPWKDPPPPQYAFLKMKGIIFSFENRQQVQINTEEGHLTTHPLCASCQ
jgi:hypothetical protein